MFLDGSKTSRALADSLPASSKLPKPSHSPLPVVESLISRLFANSWKYPHPWPGPANEETFLQIPSLCTVELAVLATDCRPPTRHAGHSRPQVWLSDVGDGTCS